MTPPIATETSPVRWAKVIDHSSCIGCHACTTACKSENLVPLSVTRTYVKYVDIGEFPQARRAFQVTRCNQCLHARLPDARHVPATGRHRRFR
jgi:Fe-S-cluster-containing dehydrogenase component